MSTSHDSYLAYGIFLDDDFFCENNIDEKYNKENNISAAGRIIEEYANYSFISLNDPEDPEDSTGLRFEGVGGCLNADPPFVVFSKTFWTYGTDYRKIESLTLNKKELWNMENFVDFVNHYYTTGKVFKPSWLLFGNVG